MLLAACTGDPLVLALEDDDARKGDEASVIDGLEGLDVDDVDDPDVDVDDVDDSDFEDREDDPDVDDHDDYDLYDPDRLVIYRLSIEPVDQERLASKPREYVPAVLELGDGDGSERLEVGLRLKGEASFKKLDAKAAFRIKVDEYHSGQRLRGRRSLTLNNMLQDRSLMAERLAYHVFRELGAPAPRANHAKVYVNDEYFGLYANIESPNKDFLERWFADPDRNLYEEAGRDFDQPGAADSFELETNERQPDGRESLKALEEACVAGDLARARELVDWPRFMLFAALEASVNQVDGYSYAQSFPNNYRIYDSEEGLVFIPWGLDWAFGGVATQDGGLYVDPFWVRPTHGVLMRMCMADAGCNQQFRDVVEHVASRWDELELEAQLDRWAAQTQEAFESDHRREVSVELALVDREVARQFIRGRAAALLEAL